MKIGIPTEVKTAEHRVALTPTGAKVLTGAGHEVVVQKGAGVGAGFTDEAYADAGAQLVPDAKAAWDADLICKVKAPIEQEFDFLSKDKAIFSYLHLAADQPLTEALVSSGMTALSYESYTDTDGSLTLLAPMSEIAGRLATQIGAALLMKHNGGRGLLLGGVSGTESAKVVILGGGTSGLQAADVAIGLGADVTVLDISLPTLRKIDARYPGRVQTLVSNSEVIAEQVAEAALVVGAVLIPGAKAPTLVTTEMIEQMRPGTVLVDIAIDQGGCFEPSRPTTHDDPTIKVGGASIYCVVNMPGAVPETSTKALCNATLPVIEQIADQGIDAAMAADERIASALNLKDGKCYLAGVAEACNLELHELGD